MFAIAELLPCVRPPEIQRSGVYESAAFLAAGTLACPSAESGERHRLSPAMATVGPGSGGVRLRFRMHADQRAADAGVRE
jgi:hypothetical protein